MISEINLTQLSTLFPLHQAMSDYDDDLLDFHSTQPMDIPGSDKEDSVILDDVQEEEPDNLSFSQSNSDLLNMSQCVRVINMSQGDRENSYSLT